MKQNTVSIQLTIQECEKLKELLLSEGWKEDESNNEYISLRMKSPSGSVCNLYTSRKVVFQGNEEFTHLIGTIKGNADEKFIPHIGVDEVGKGDYFGPLVVVACFVDQEFKNKLLEIGVADSKRFTDNVIRKMYSKIKEYPYYYSSILKPTQYNDLNDELKNVSIILAKQHAKVIEMALEDLKANSVECKRVVIDQFSSRKSRVTDELGKLGKGIEFVQFHKGESDIAVAAASIIARGIFLEEMDNLNDQYYFTFPKGATHVIPQAKEFVQKHGSKELRKVAKIGFKTTKQVMQTSF